MTNSRKSNKTLYFFNFSIVFICTAIIFVGLAAGQTDSELSGRVVDANGDVVPGAIVAVSRSDIRFKMESVTDAQGVFRFANLIAGTYRLTATAKNFGTTAKNIEFPSANDVVLSIAPEEIAAEISITSSYLAGSPESLSEIPGSIERLDAQALENSRVLNFAEALRKISGVNVRDEEGFGTRPNIGIRGTNPTRSTKVLLLEDGIPLSYAPYGDNASYYHPPIERYESIEVLKGSGQIAYGPQTIAGVVNYLTPNPTEKPTFELKLLGGNREFFNGSFQGSGTIGKTGIITSFTRKQGDGARDNVDSEINDVSTKIVRTLNDKNVVTFKFTYYGENSNVTYSGLTEAEFAANPRGNPFKNDFFFADRFGFSTSHTALLSEKAVLTTNFYTNYFKRHWWRQSSNSSQRPNRLNLDPDCLSFADLNTTCGNEGRLRDYTTVGIEPRFTYNYDAGRLFRGELQTGFRIHWEHQDRLQLIGDRPDSRTGIPAEINIRRNQAYSAFVQNRFVFGDFAVTPGVRIEKIDIERENLLVQPNAFGKTDVTEVIPGIGVAYSGLPRTTIFGGIHRGFSPPRAEDIISNTGGVVELDPEESINYELGFRTNPIRGTRLEGTYFRLDYDNQVIPASLAGGIGAVLTNGGKTLQEGFEFSAQVDSSAFFGSRHNVYLRTAYTWIPTAEFRGERFSAIDKTVSITGNRLPYAPKTLMTTAIGYSHARGFDGFIEGVYTGRQFADDLNTVDPTPNGQRGAIGSQTYFNATANYKIETWKTTFFVTVKNIFDRLSIVDRTRGIYPSTPRLIQAGLKMNF